MNQKAKQVIQELDITYPRANLPGAWWLGNGMVELRAVRGRLLLEGFWVAPNRRQQGHGAAMLDIVCGLADRAGVEIDTWADRYDKKHEGLYNGQLRDWYARWRFFPHPTRKGWLRRLPTARGQRNRLGRWRDAHGFRYTAIVGDYLPGQTTPTGAKLLCYAHKGMK